jgi:hypothetical protein
MTCPSRTSALGLVAALTAVACLAGCGGAAPDSSAPRQAAAAFVQRLSHDDAKGLCRSLSQPGVRELARDFGGPTCAATAAAALRYIAARPSLRAAIAGTVVLPNSDIPLSPAPLHVGQTTTRLRLVVDDPVLRRRQALDVVMRLAAGRWRVDSGANALMTIVRAPPRASR